MAKNCQNRRKLPKITRHYQKLRKKLPKQPKITKNCQKLPKNPKITKNKQKLP